VKITIISEQLRGYSNIDLSIEIPETGEIVREKPFHPMGEPKITEFKEHHNWASKPLRSFPAVRVGDFYMLWIEERKEWIGIEYREYPHHYEGASYGIEENIEADGPFKLSEDWARLISEAFENSSLSLEEVLHTAPPQLTREK